MGETPIFPLTKIPTLFHEFGHAMHLLLTDTKFVQISGTRVAVGVGAFHHSQADAVELPSTLFERFADDADILAAINETSRKRSSFVVSSNHEMVSLFPPFHLVREDSSRSSRQSSQRDVRTPWVGVSSRYRHFTR